MGVFTIGVGGICKSEVSRGWYRFARNDEGDLIGFEADMCARSADTDAKENGLLNFGYWNGTDWQSFSSPT